MIRTVVLVMMLGLAVPASAQTIDEIKIENAKLKRENAALKKQLESEKPCVEPIIDEPSAQATPQE